MHMHSHARARPRISAGPRVSNRFIDLYGVDRAHDQSIHFPELAGVDDYSTLEPSSDEDEERKQMKTEKRHLGLTDLFSLPGYKRWE